jgi:hypothetical protein
LKIDLASETPEEYLAKALTLLTGRAWQLDGNYLFWAR